MTYNGAIVNTRHDQQSHGTLTVHHRDTALTARPRYVAAYDANDHILEHRRGQELHYCSAVRADHKITMTFHIKFGMNVDYQHDILPSALIEILVT